MVTSLFVLALLAATLGGIGKLLSETLSPQVGRPAAPRSHSSSTPAVRAFDAEPVTGGAVQFLAPAAESVGPHAGGGLPPDGFGVASAWLELEKGRQMEAGEVGGSVVGSRTRRVLHRRGCRWSEKIMTANAVSFTSAAAAESAGYRPCRYCDGPSVVH